MNFLNSKFLKYIGILLWIFAANFCIIKQCHAESLINNSHACCDKTNKTQDDCCASGKCFHSVKVEKTELDSNLVSLVYDFIQIIEAPSINANSEFKISYIVLVFKQLNLLRQSIFVNAPPLHLSI